ncbi:aminotransferase class V-fold PLP-dependent enzyme [Candidatus Bathyarchaeota archaeon]|nr:MAG: aminotransferase class V-fold PLP-dependent enzyme [Candidatus Bathyarchaeota archaeon]
MKDMESVREQFPVTKNKVFLNHAAESPLPKPVADAVHKYVEEFSNFGESSIELEDRGKSLFAKLINAKPEELAIVENTSMGLNIAANLLRYPPGSKIVTTDMEYPSVVYPWLRKSLPVKVHYVKNVNGKILLEDMEKAVDDNTVAVVISHVEYFNGFRNDLGAISEIAHEHGAYVIVDAIQSAGAVKIDVKKDDVDFLTCACYKWLLGPPGAGYLYVKRELVEKFEPPLVGWLSVKPEVFETIDFWDIWSLKLSETASRFEVGTPSFISIAGIIQALKMFLDFGMENVERRILKLTDYLIETVKDLGLKLQTPEEKQYRSGIVNFKISNPKELAEKLNGKNIVVSARSHGIRVSPHFYNIEEEIDTLMEEVKRWNQA